MLKLEVQTGREHQALQLLTAFKLASFNLLGTAYGATVDYTGSSDQCIEHLQSLQLSASSASAVADATTSASV